MLGWSNFNVAFMSAGWLVAGALVIGKLVGSPQETPLKPEIRVMASTDAAQQSPTRAPRSDPAAITINPTASKVAGSQPDADWNVAREQPNDRDRRADRGQRFPQQRWNDGQRYRGRDYQGREGQRPYYGDRRYTANPYARPWRDWAGRDGQTRDPRYGYGSYRDGYWASPDRRYVPWGQRRYDNGAWPSGRWVWMARPS